MSDQKKEPLDTQREQAEKDLDFDGGDAKESPVAQKPEKESKKKEKGKKSNELDQLKEELGQLNDRLLRTAAEFDNYRKRTEKEKLQSISYGCGTAIDKLLPVLDNLERAAGVDCSDAEYKKGVDMTLDSFRAALTALGVSEIEAEGVAFNPELHCAVSREQHDDAPSGSIIRVLQKGYKLGDRILRYAMVSVAE
jgi:molecular chaperone GrpE